MSNSHSQLSSALRITNINDFLAPSNSCILPVGGGAVPAPAGSVLSPIIPMESASAQVAPLKATVTVSDCLACSGCVTSAETVLLSTENLDVLRKFVKQREAALSSRKSHFAVVTLSQQSVASIAVRFNLSLTSTARRLSTFLKRHLCFDGVVDSSMFTQISLLESAAEFIQRYREGKRLTISSACPGWLTYAEKTQDSVVLDAISSIRSAQGIAGSLAKYLKGPNDQRPVWLLSIAQCHDKKLEAVRPEFIKSPENALTECDVNCVITTGELMQLIEEYEFDFSASDETCLDRILPVPTKGTEFGVAVGSGSDGYAEFVLRQAASELLGVTVHSGEIGFEKCSKTGDVKMATVKSADGLKLLRFATAYGFRSLQSILRKIRRGECQYDYIELMACPGGCNNGGGQLPLMPNENENSPPIKQQNVEHLKAVDQKFLQAPRFENPLAIPEVRNIYDNIFRDGIGSENAICNTMLKITSRKEGAVASLDW